MHEKKLNLNSAKLKDLRKAVLDRLNGQVSFQLQQGLSIDQVMMNLAKSQLRKDNKEYYAFFTSIRSYLGKSAENFLEDMNYKG